ncbi:MAG: hypothetical protein CL512_05890 [Actinobacteria bacterium]|nr:hypothetical protein [Actinomycetota bacterium]
MRTVWDNVVFFERMVAEYAGSRYAVAVDSCSNALFLSMMYKRQKLGADSSVETLNIPSKTYISVPMMAIHCGHRINFTNENWEGTYKLDPLNIVDGAQRFTYGMYEKGSLHCLSFHSKKILSIGRGGMILTDSSTACSWLKSARYDGRPSIYYNDLAEKIPPRCIGWHMYMTPEEAIRGIEQFYKLPKSNPDSGKSSDYKVDLSKLKVFEPYLAKASDIEQ